MADAEGKNLQPQKVEDLGEGYLDLDLRSDLAVHRTELALCRTQLAWVRTALALIAASVAMDKVMEALHKARLEMGTAWVKYGHASGLWLAGIATALLMLATLDYWKAARALTRTKSSRASLMPTLAASVLVVLVGAVVLIALLCDPAY